MKTKKAIRIIPAFVAVFIYLTTIAFAQNQTPNRLDDIGKYIKIERLSSKVIVVRTGVFYFDAVIAISTQKGIVLIDAGASPSLTGKYRMIIENEFKRNDFKYIINTHSHWDHTNGSVVFPEAIIIGHDSCKIELTKEFADRGARFNIWQSLIKQLNETRQSVDSDSELGKQVDYRINLIAMTIDDLEKDYRINVPSITFSNSLMLDMGDITFHLKYFGKAHSQSDIIVYVPEENLLLTGDLFNKGGNGNLTQLNSGKVKKEDVDRWKNVMSYLIGLNVDFSNIIDGHAAFLKKSDLNAFSKNVDFLWGEFNAGREISARVRLETVFRKSGVDSMKNEFDLMRNRDKDKYYFQESTLIEFGYHLLKDKEFEAAVELFKIVIEKFPNSPNAYDSLGETYMTMGNKQLAIENYEKSLKLNPESQSGKDALKQLKGKK